MRDLSAQAGIGTDPAYLNGNLVDNQTVIGEGVNQDLVQFFQKLADLASISPNNLPDNETNGYQLITALEAVVRDFAASTTQKGTSERATQSEVNGGTDTERYIAANTLRGTVFVPGQIPNISADIITSGTLDHARLPIATESAPGAAEIGTTTEVNLGIADDKIVTPLKLAGRTATDTRAGVIETATSTETEGLIDTTRAVTPGGLKSVLEQAWNAIFPASGYTITLSQNLRVRKINLTTIHLIGFVQKDATLTNLITTLPAAFRPISNRWFPVSCDYDSGTGANVNNVCYLATNGEIRFNISTTNTYTLCINAIIPINL